MGHHDHYIQQQPMGPPPPSFNQGYPPQGGYYPQGGYPQGQYPPQGYGPGYQQPTVIVQEQRRSSGGSGCLPALLAGLCCGCCAAECCDCCTDICCGCCD